MKNKQDDNIDLPNKLLLTVSSTNLSLSYKYSLDKAIANELWEFGVTVIWKFVILFFYEKLYQSFLLGQLHQDFINALEGRKRDCHNCFSFNCLEDDYLFQKMDCIWRNLDGNYKNIFRRLLDERNSLSHVNEYPYSEVKFRAYAEDSLNLVNYLQKLHLQLNLEKTHKFIHANGSFLYLSALEIEESIKKWSSDTELLIYLTSLIPLGQIQDNWIVKIKDVAIEQFVSATSFDGARIKGLKLVKPLVPYFEKSDFSKIIGGLIEKDNRQVLFAGGIEETFVAMYVECVNNFPDLEEEWVKFLKGIEKIQATDYFKELKVLVE
jgi:hypothetical protein